MSFLPQISTKKLVILIVSLAVAVVALVIYTKRDQQERAAAAASWDTTGARPASAALTRRNDADTTIIVPRTITPQDVNEDWCHCSMTRGGGGLGRTIMRYPTVHELRSMYEGAKATGNLSAGRCVAYNLLNSVDELRVASTTDAISLTYAKGGRTLTICFLAPDKLTDDDRLVTWSDQSPYGYP